MTQLETECYLSLVSPYDISSLAQESFPALPLATAEDQIVPPAGGTCSLCVSAGLVCQLECLAML